MPIIGLAGLALPAAPDNQEHSSGFLGFLVIFLLALAVYLLVRNMTARLRRMNYRHEEELDPQTGAPRAGGDGTSARR
ncbi:MAG: hypothetical protein V9G19_22640 [Tetrasphaera sp.]